MGESGKLGNRAARMHIGAEFIGEDRGNVLRVVSYQSLCTAPVRHLIFALRRRVCDVCVDDDRRRRA